MHSCMNWQNIAFDWNHIRAFLVTAEEGTLSAAARALGLTQPTLGRQITALEETLGVTLFDRIGRRLLLTPIGKELLAHVRPMGDAAGRISLMASGYAQSVEGTVSITATDLMSAYVLPSFLRKLREIAPGISVKIIAENSISDLQRHEADIALRHVRPEQPDLIAKRLPDIEAQFLAARSYLSRFRSTPPSIEELNGADYIGVGEDDEGLLAAYREFGLTIDQGNFPYGSQSAIVCWQLLRAGLGMSLFPSGLTDIDPEVVPVFPDRPPITFPTWLTTHRELHTNRRIRIVFDLLSEHFSKKKPGREATGFWS